VIDLSMMSGLCCWYHEKQEENKKLIEDDDDSHLDAEWANPKSMKQSLVGGGRSMQMRPGGAIR